MYRHHFHPADPRYQDTACDSDFPHAIHGLFKAAIFVLPLLIIGRKMHRHAWEFHAANGPEAQKWAEQSRRHRHGPVPPWCWGEKIDSPEAQEEFNRWREYYRSHMPPWCCGEEKETPAQTSQPETGEPSA